MLATHTAGLDLFRPSVVRVHELPERSAAPRLHFAPALSFPQHVTVQQAIEALRQMQPENEAVYYLFVTDYESRLVGVVSLWQLVVSPPGAHLFEIMDRRMITLPPDASVEEQARLMSETGLMALPVVDEDGRLVGAMDSNELIVAVKDEATEGICYLAGMEKGAEETTEEPSLFATIRARGGWLLVGLVSALIVAAILSLFEATIARFTILAIFLPVIAGLSSRAATQTLAFVVRSLALGTLSVANLRSVLTRELTLGLAHGVGLGVLAGAAGWLWQSNLVFGIVAGVALFGALLVAALAGVVVPCTLKKLHLHPARGASLLVTTVTGMGSVIFFMGLGSLAVHMGYM